MMEVEFEITCALGKPNRPLQRLAGLAPREWGESPARRFFEILVTTVTFTWMTTIRRAHPRGNIAFQRRIKRLDPLGGS
jgi:hypothetical protein